jgi:hypothetical protein
LGPDPERTETKQWGGMSISTDTVPEPARLTVNVQHLDGHADILVIGELDIATAPASTPNLRVSYRDSS